MSETFSKEKEGFKLQEESQLRIIIQSWPLLKRKSTPIHLIKEIELKQVPN
jgi:hypothetical protein